VLSLEQLPDGLVSPVLSIEFERRLTFQDAGQRAGISAFLDEAIGA
jgi:hypothetical protein